MNCQILSTLPLRRLALSVVLISHFACASGNDTSEGSSSDRADGDESGDGDRFGGGDGDGDRFGGGDGFGGAAPLPIRDDLPPEIETKPNYLAPVVTGNYLWSANPQSGRISIIEGSSLQVEIVSAGLLPTYMAGLPEPEKEARALVINVGSNEASLLRVNKNGDPNTVTEQRVPIHELANRWEVGSEGSYAIAFSQIESGDLSDNDSRQEITVLSLPKPSKPSAPVPTRLTVGYRPSQVVISEAAQRAVVVAEDGITLIKLPDDKNQKPARQNFIELLDNSDVSISPDSRYAMVRLPDSTDIELYDFNREKELVKIPTVIPFPAVVTDLDLAPNGRGVAVLRARDTLGTFLLSELIADPAAIDYLDLDGEAVGSAVLSGNGQRTVLYQTAKESNEVVIVDLMAETYLAYRTLSLNEPVRNVEVSEDGEHAVALTYLFENQPSSFAALSIGKDIRFPRIIGTLAPINSISIRAKHALITTTSPSVSEAFFIQLPSLAVSSTLLSAPPLASGILSNLDKGFVAQEHPSGRLSFYELDNGQAQTLTGYELSADVVNQ